MQSITSINPANNQVLETYPLLNREEVLSAIDRAHEQYQVYRKSTIESRSQKMCRVADILLENVEDLALLMTQEMGKTLSSAKAEVEKCAWVCRYYAEHADRFLADEWVETDASKSYISYQPLGVLLAVMPWNYPLWQVFRFAAPALMAGNAVLLKHASNVPGCALAIAQIFKDAGFHQHLFQSLIIKSDLVSDIIAHPKVMAATLTGSNAAGSAVGALAGQHIKKTVLELGGNDPYIILHDADLAHAAQQCAQSRLLNAGQSCIGAKRFIVVDAVYDQFLQLFMDEMKRAIMGDPMQKVDLGPLARTDLRDEVHEQVKDSVSAGAQLLLGGYIPDMAGAYYPPTILSAVAPGMPAYDAEIFGPVAAVIRVKDEQEAIRVANDSIYGLGSCVFTHDLERGERIAREEIQAGCCFVNQFTKSDPRLPFGGIKQSGYGRELSLYGIRTFVNVKTVYVR